MSQLTTDPLVEEFRAMKQGAGGGAPQEDPLVAEFRAMKAQMPQQAPPQAGFIDRTIAGLQGVGNAMRFAVGTQPPPAQRSMVGEAFAAGERQVPEIWKNLSGAVSVAGRTGAFNYGMPNPAMVQIGDAGQQAFGALARSFPPTRNDTPGAVINKTVDVAGQVAPGVGMAMIPGAGLPLAAAYYGATGAGQYYDSATQAGIQQGMDPEEARNRAAFGGAIAAIPSAAMAFAPGPQAAAGRALATTIGSRVAGSAVARGATELGVAGLQQAGLGAAQRLSESGLQQGLGSNPEALRQTLSQMPHDALVDMLVGGVSHGAIRGPQALGEHLDARTAEAREAARAQDRSDAADVNEQVKAQYDQAKSAGLNVPRPESEAQISVPGEARTAEEKAAIQDRLHEPTPLEREALQNRIAEPTQSESLDRRQEVSDRLQEPTAQQRATAAARLNEPTNTQLQAGREAGPPFDLTAQHDAAVNRPLYSDAEHVRMVQDEVNRRQAQGSGGGVSNIDALLRDLDARSAPAPGTSPQSQEIEAKPPAPQGKDYSGLKYPELRAQAKARGLPDKGSATALRERLQAQDAGKWQAPKEPTNAVAEPKAAPANAGRSPQPSLRQEGGDIPEGWRGFLGGGSAEGPVREEAKAEEATVAPAKAPESTKTADVKASEPEVHGPEISKMSDADLLKEIEAGGHKFPEGSTPTRKALERVAGDQRKKNNPLSTLTRLFTSEESGVMAGTAPGPKPVPSAPGKPAPAPKPANPGPTLATRAKSFVAGIRGIDLPKMWTSAKDLANAAVEHASSRMASPYIARSMLAKVAGDNYKDQAFLTKLGAVLTQDNLDSVRVRRMKEEGLAGASKVHTLIGAGRYFADRAEFNATLNDPEVAAAIQRWKNIVNPWMDEQYRRIKDIAPGMTLDERGVATGARINLHNLDHANPDLIGKPVGSDLNTLSPRTQKQRHPFDMRANGEGQSYDMNADTILQNTVGRTWQRATKYKFYQGLVDAGDAKYGEKPDSIKGEDVFPIDTKAGRTYVHDDSTTFSKPPEVLWVRKSLQGEVGRVLGTGKIIEQPALAKVFQGVNWLQTKLGVDAAFHAKNIVSAISTAPGGSSGLAEFGRKAGLALPDAMVRLAQKSAEIKLDSPESRDRLAFLAQHGMMREGQGVLGGMDKAARLVLDDFYSDLVKRGKMVDSIDGRRQFINQIGQYNSRLAPVWKTFIREVGLSPFLVAGETFNRLGSKVLTGSPRGQTTSLGQNASIRATQMAGTVMSSLVLPGIYNYMTTGKAVVPGVPIGGYSLGKTEDGKNRYWESPATQLLHRGMGNWGLEQAVEGTRQGMPGNLKGETAISEAVNHRLHPFLGPPTQVGSAFLTGKEFNPFGGDNLKQVVPTPKPTENKWVGRSLYGAAQAQPLVARFAQAGVKAPEDAPGYLKRAAEPFLGALGYKESKPPDPNKIMKARERDYREDQARQRRKSP